MKIFITGSNGFVGKHLKEYLQQNHNDYVLFTPSSCELDLADEAAVDRYMEANRPDMIIHLANKGGSRDTAEMRNVTEYNLRIFFNLAKYEKDVKKIISFGSGAEYGKHKPIVDVKEKDYLLMQPLDEYGFYKSVTSKYIERSQKIMQLRIFGAYGEHENYRYKFISNAIVKNLLELPITINKNVFFDYIYIDDLLRMIDWFIHNDANEKIYNVTTGKKIDLISLAEMVNEAGAYQSEIMLLNDGLNDEYSSDNGRVLREIGDFEFTPHKSAIAKMRAYFEANLDKLDIQTVKEDPYLKVCEKMWKKNSEESK